MNQPLRVERRGRKRKPGARHPSGQLVREKPLDPVVIAMRMPHRAGVPAAMAHDAKAENVLGRYQLNGLITGLEYDAGVYYRGVVGRYLILMGAPKSNMPSCTGEAASRGMPEDFTADEAERRKRQYNEAFEAVEETGGQRGAKALSRVAVYDCLCPVDLFGYMRLSLVGLLLARGMVSKTQGLDIRRKIRERYVYIR